MKTHSISQSQMYRSEWPRQLYYLRGQVILKFVKLNEYSCCTSPAVPHALLDCRTMPPWWCRLGAAERGRIRKCRQIDRHEKTLACFRRRCPYTSNRSPRDSASLKISNFMEFSSDRVLTIVNWWLQDLFNTIVNDCKTCLRLQDLKIRLYTDYGRILY